MISLWPLLQGFPNRSIDWLRAAACQKPGCANKQTSIHEMEHVKPCPLWSSEKLLSMELVPSAPEVGVHCPTVLLYWPRLLDLLSRCIVWKPLLFKFLNVSYIITVSKWNNRVETGPITILAVGNNTSFCYCALDLKHSEFYFRNLLYNSFQISGFASIFFVSLGMSHKPHFKMERKMRQKINQ